MGHTSTKQIIDEIKLLSVDERASIADSILENLTPIDREIQEEWLSVAESRLEELTSGKVQGIPGEEVFKKIDKKSK